MSCSKPACWWDSGQAWTFLDLLPHLSSFIFVPVLNPTWENLAHKTHLLAFALPREPHCHIQRNGTSALLLLSLKYLITCGANSIFTCKWLIKEASPFIHGFIAEGKQGITHKNGFWICQKDQQRLCARTKPFLQHRGSKSVWEEHI